MFLYRAGHRWAAVLLPTWLMAVTVIQYLRINQETPRCRYGPSQVEMNCAGRWN
jgi:hypothetical protein